MSNSPTPKNTDLEKIIRKIINLHSVKKEVLIKKYNIEWLIHELTPDLL